jgi:D-3-phosphoglycerate dehydrogenase / 2-oxoglutarate reductase
MKPFKVVITDYEFEHLTYERQVLEDPRIKVEAYQCKTEDEVIEVCRDADAIICQYAPMTEKVINQLTKCKLISRYGIGTNNIDIEAATRKKICISNAPDCTIEEVSNHALAFILDAVRKITVSNYHVKRGVWDYTKAKPIFRLADKVLGLIGFGNIPQRLVEKVKPLGMEIVVYDPFVSEEILQKYGVTRVSLEELCKKSHIISLHTPLTQETEGLMNDGLFELMQKGTILINTSRGPVIKEDSLLKALENGTIAVAGLDVFENEPISEGHPFLQMENVTLTPHMAWYSEEGAVEVRCKTALGSVDVLLYNEYPKYLVNRVLLDDKLLNFHEAHERYNFEAAVINKIIDSAKLKEEVR